MPQKIRELRATLAKTGFTMRPSKGSHTFWYHPSFPDLTITISGQDGDDAQKYQIKAVRDILKRLGERR